MLGGNSTSKELVELRNKQEPSLPGAKALKKTVSTTTVSMGPVSVPRKGVEACYLPPPSLVTAPKSSLCLP